MVDQVVVVIEVSTKVHERYVALSIVGIVDSRESSSLRKHMRYVPLFTVVAQ